MCGIFKELIIIIISIMKNHAFLPTLSHLYAKNAATNYLFH